MFNKRTLLKSLGWRVIATTISVISLLAAGAEIKWAISVPSLIIIVEFAVKIPVYCAYDRLWERGKG